MSKSDNSAWNGGIVGKIDGVEVRVSVEGDEELGEHVLDDLTNRADVIKQMVDGGIPPQYTEDMHPVDWVDYLGLEEVDDDE